MKATKLIILVLATISLSSATKTKVWSADTHGANLTQLAACVAEMQAMLVEDPKVLAIRFYRYQCSDYWIQWGSNLRFVPTKTNLWVFERCKDEFIEAAHSAKDWFHSHVKGGWGSRIVAYSPYGYKACWNKKSVDHALCEMIWSSDN